MSVFCPKLRQNIELEKFGLYNRYKKKHYQLTSPDSIIEADDERTYFIIHIPCHSEFICDELRMDKEGHIIPIGETWNRDVTGNVTENVTNFILTNMKEETIQKEIDKLMNNLPNHLGDIVTDILNYSNQSGILEIYVNGFYNEKLYFDFTRTDIRHIYGWLENLLINITNSPKEFILGKEKNSGDIYNMGIKLLTGNPGYYHEKYWKSDLSIPLEECCIFYTYNSTEDRIGRSMFSRVEDLVRRMYTTLRNSNKIRLKSEIIESFYQAKQFHLEYKGYSTTTMISVKDLRFYGKFISPDKTEVEGWEIAANNYPEFKTSFESVVEKIIENDKWNRTNKEWINNTDTISIGCVFNILPVVFKERIVKKQYDLSLNTVVKGGAYEVPLYYVTKAWDILLKGDLCHNEFRVEYDPEYDDEPVDRTLEDAISQNDEMKSIWKELLGIDIDLLDVNFFVYNKHLPPNASEDEMYCYFQDVPDGIEEWILDGINSPKGGVQFDYVSSLMEFTAYTLYERQLNNKCLWRKGECPYLGINLTDP